MASRCTFQQKTAWPFPFIQSIPTTSPRFIFLSSIDGLYAAPGGEGIYGACKALVWAPYSYEASWTRVVACFAVGGAADVQDRDGALPLLASVRYAFPWLRHVFADSAYAGDKLKGALEKLGTWTMEIVKRSDTAKGFVLLPHRWVVERTFAWLGRCRRLAKDWETSVASSTAWALIASIRMITRRTARYCLA